MKRLGAWMTAAACACLTATANGTARADDTQTWHWNYVTQTASGPPLTAQSSVTIGAKKVHMTYSVPVQNRELVIESCDADLRDVVDATTVRNAGTTYFLIRFSPSHGAVCGSGRRPAVALPADDERYVGDVAAAHILCLTADPDAVRGEIFNVMQENYQVRQLAMLVAGSLSLLEPPIRVDLQETALPKLVRNYRMSNAKLSKALGFTPSVTVLESIQNMIEKLPAAEELAHPQYYNIRWMTLLESIHVSQREFASIY